MSRGSVAMPDRGRSASAGGVPWSLCVLVAALLATWFPMRAPLRDAATWQPADAVEVVVPAAYVACSPLCRALDAVTMLSVAQLVAALVTGLVLLAAWAYRPGVAESERQPSRWSARRGVFRSMLVVGVALVALAASVALLPYPMLALSTGNADEVRVDFHSHTAASHDARPRFDVAMRRAWHAAAGFDVAYVTDHRALEGAEEARAHNPARAGDGMVLLPAYEGRYLGSFVVFLGLRQADSTLIDARRHLRDGMSSGGRLPISVAVPPGLLLRDVTAQSRDSLPRIRALQVWDGSPVASWQGQRERRQLLERAAALGIPVVSGTNHHGWGRTAAAWSLVRLPGWRSLTPDSLGAALEAILRDGASDRVRVVERLRPDPRDSRLALVWTLPAAVWMMLRSLTPWERMSWLAWGVAASVVANRRRPFARLAGAARDGVRGNDARAGTREST